MKKLLLIFMLLVVITGCISSENVTIEPGTILDSSSIVPDNERGITLELVEGSLSSTSILLKLTNATDNTLYFGTPYAIEKFENDKWNTLKYVRENIGWFMPLLSVNAGDTYEFGAKDWEYRYGKLPKGKYRFVKSVYFEDDDEFYISYEFEIE